MTRKMPPLHPRNPRQHGSFASFREPRWLSCRDHQIYISQGGHCNDTKTPNLCNWFLREMTENYKQHFYIKLDAPTKLGHIQPLPKKHREALFPTDLYTSNFPKIRSEHLVFFSAPGWGQGVRPGRPTTGSLPVFFYSLNGTLYKRGMSCTSCRLSCRSKFGFHH